MAEPDELFTLKNQFWVGNYSSAISEGTMLNHIRDALRIERDFYVLRSEIALGNLQQVLTSIPATGATTPIALSAVRVLATYLDNGDKEMIDLTLKEWLMDPASAENPQLLLIAGMIYGREHKYSDALSALTKGNTLEHSMHIVHLYLSMNRLDLARKQVQEMKKIEEDSTLTQLATSWCLTYAGGEQADEATLHFQELADRFGATPLLLNGAASAFMAMRNFTEAERLLTDAIHKDPRNEDTLINLIAVNTHLSKSPDAILQYVLQLQQIAPQHAFVQEYSRLDREFSSTAAAVARS